MSILKNLFDPKKHSIRTYQDFWSWFADNEKAFFKAVKNGENIERDFFEKLTPKLSELGDGFYYLTGMDDDNTAELILTADGATERIVYVEKLVEAAPYIPGWKFTSLKPALDIENVCIKMECNVFDKESLSFYINEYPDFPDEIDITVVYHDFDEDNKTSIISGVHIFLDNFLGELNYATTIDNLRVSGKDDAMRELIPIEKLKDYLIWREKEFVERYEVVRYNSEDDSYATLSAELENGRTITAMVNSTLLEWNGKASHPWLLNLEVQYDGEDTNGLPNDHTCQILDQMEEEMMGELKEADGYLNAARKTADNSRNIYFVCKDFRKPSKVADYFKSKYSDKFEISFSIYKDKYWQTLDQFRVG